jgi:hypothetical protein
VPHIVVRSLEIFSRERLFVEGSGSCVRLCVAEGSGSSGRRGQWEQWTPRSQGAVGAEFVVAMRNCIFHLRNCVFQLRNFRVGIY